MTSPSPTSSTEPPLTVSRNVSATVAPVAPCTVLTELPIRIDPERNDVTADAPGTAATALATLSDTGEKFFAVMMKSAPTLLSIWALAEVVIDAAITDIVVVRAMPIINADGVAAVRRGFRSAFSLPGLPVVPQTRGR